MKFLSDHSSLEKKQLGAKYTVDKNIVIKDETSQNRHKYSEEYLTNLASRHPEINRVPHSKTCKSC